MGAVASTAPKKSAPMVLAIVIHGKYGFHISVHFFIEDNQLRGICHRHDIMRLGWPKTSFVKIKQ